MHTIDLLKGKGLPAKTTFGSVFFVVLMFIVPLLVGAAMTCFYINNRIEIGIKKASEEKLLKDIDKLKPNAELTANLVKEKSVYAARLIEVSKCVDTYNQWTPVLIDVAKDMPEKMRINKLIVTNDDSKSAGKKNSDPNKPLAIPIPQRKMTLDLSGSGTEDNNLKVREYQEKLRSASSLGPEFLKSLTYFRQPGTADNSEDTYTMTFVFEKQKK